MLLGLSRFCNSRDQESEEGLTIQRDFLKGNEALAYGALRAGLNAYFAYPITPSSEIPETLAKEFRNPNYREFKVFLQAASELEAINMVIGAASTGVKVMTATSGPGFSLKQEGLSYAAGMEVPFLVVDVNRAGHERRRTWRVSQHRPCTKLRTGDGIISRTGVLTRIQV